MSERPEQPENTEESLTDFERQYDTDYEIEVVSTGSDEDNRKD